MISFSVMCRVRGRKKRGKKALKNVKYIVIQGVSVPTVSIDDLIKMKENTGRAQDEADIGYLRRVKNEKV